MYICFGVFWNFSYVFEEYFWLDYGGGIVEVGCSEDYVLSNGEDNGRRGVFVFLKSSFYV